MEKLILAFCATKKFEMKLYLAHHLNSSEMHKARKYWMSFYVRFTDYMYDDLGYYDNYVGHVIKNLKAFLNYVNEDTLIQIGSFHDKFHVPKEEIQIVTLTPAQLNYLIYDKQLHNQLSPNLRIIKDTFVLGCTVAMRFSDLMALSKHNLTVNENRHYLKIQAEKTNVESNIWLPEYAVEILKRYESKRKTLLPSFSNAYFNIQLKKLSAFINLSEPMIKVRTKRRRPLVIYKNQKERKHYTMADHITTHTMRRTAITVMLRLGMDEQAVRKVSGHSAGSKEFYKYVSFSQSYLDIQAERTFTKLAELQGISR